MTSIGKRRLKPSTHNSIFVAEDKDFVVGCEKLLCAGNTFKRFLLLMTIFNIKHARHSFSMLITEGKIFVASDKNFAVCTRL